MTAALWLSTGQTVVLLASCAWAWWASTKIAHLLNAADIVQQHSEAGAQYANRAALDARAMLDVLTEHWQAMRDQQPQTEPMERVGGPATVPAHDAITPEAIAAEPDPWVKQQMTEILATLAPPKPEPAKKATSRPRKRTAV